MTQPTTQRVALVTGGTTGIGLATAKQLLDDGYHIVVTGQDPDRVAAARQTLGAHAVVLRADARAVADAEQVAKEIERRFGHLDLAFLNAGIARFAPLEAFDEAFYQELMDVNVKGVIFQLQKVLPLLRSGSSVVLNTSVVAHKGVASATVYSATKGAVSALLGALAAELASKGIRVNAVSPGPIETPIYGKLGLPGDALSGFKSGMTSQVPLQRFGSDAEVARAVAFLGSSAASYLHGVELAVDGGLAAV